MTISNKSNIFISEISNELLNPFNYLICIFVGILINLAQSKSLIQLVPYIIPLLVTITFQTIKNYRNRYHNLLIKLPEFNEDPVFVIDNIGNIIETTGKTKNLFNSKSIDKLEHIFENKDIRLIFSRLEKIKKSTNTETFEIYSEILQKWYLVNVKNFSDLNAILVWMFDINARKSLDYSISSISDFFNQVYSNESKETIINKIPTILLQEGYGAIYMATKNSYGILGGFIHMNRDDMFIKSDYIPLHEGKSLLNRVKTIKGEIIHAKKSDVDMNNHLLEFLDFEIEEFLSYDHDELSIVCFNKDLGIFESDRKVLSIIIDIALLTIQKN
jgi:hypothetical protein